ncbi:unnamed protein product [Nippostrongylus brasiliensis]|uniref:Ovule protein n=1 Tax=Nippostrongylus brasiliensis TaxID=27835 RepID=A0A0N4XF75_NIPBR|nr:unnamed protein product [Nippostrongylus brasiliensis]
MSLNFMSKTQKGRRILLVSAFSSIKLKIYHRVSTPAVIIRSSSQKRLLCWMEMLRMMVV